MSQDAPLWVRSHKNWTEEVPAIYNVTEVFLNNMSYVIKTVGSPVHCNDVTPPRYKFTPTGSRKARGDVLASCRWDSLATAWDWNVQGFALVHPKPPPKVRVSYLKEL